MFPHRALQPLFTLAVLLGVSACEVRPPPGFADRCVRDSDCRAPYRCLPGPLPGQTGTVTFCTVMCASRTDCPYVFSQHCGDERTCRDGVCTLFGCM